MYYVLPHKIGNNSFYPMQWIGLCFLRKFLRKVLPSAWDTFVVGLLSVVNVIFIIIFYWLLSWWLRKQLTEKQVTAKQFNETFFVWCTRSSRNKIWTSIEVYFILSLWCNTKLLINLPWIMPGYTTVFKHLSSVTEIQ